MIIKFSVDQPSRCRRHSVELPLYGYYGTEQVIEELSRVLEYHELKYQKYKKEYIEKWGEKLWNKYEESERELK